MGEVVDLDIARPHQWGKAQCSECLHLWIAVAPVGVKDLSCPHCGKHTGTFTPDPES